MTLFPLLHVVVGVGITWTAVAMWVNRTIIEVNDGRLTCTHGPLPFSFDKARPVALRDVALFEVESKARGSKEDHESALVWQLVARTEDGERFPVVTRLTEERQATCLHRRLEQHLG